jgi:hypothetical protein
MGEDCYSKYYVAEKFGGAYKMMNKKRKKRKKGRGRKKENKQKKEKKIKMILGSFSLSLKS